MNRALLGLLLLTLTSPLAAEELRLFELQHRSAEELIPMLRPLLPPQAGISGSGNTLMVRSTAQELAQLNEVLQQLDRPSRQLLISVQQGQQGQLSQSGIEVQGKLDQPQTRIYSTRRQQLESQGQQLRVSEGHWASIRSGQAVPQIVRSERHDASGSSVQQGVEYRDVESGFEVRPRLSGDQVSLEIRPFTARLSQGGAGLIEQQAVITTITGRLGEWIPIAGVDTSTRESDSGTIYATRDRQRQTQDVQLKVELLE